MFRNHKITRSHSLAVTLLLVLGAISATAQTTQFTYQGLLNDGGGPANGSYDLQFRLFDAAIGGTQVGSTLIREDVAVTNGLFKVALDFGAAAFPRADRFLEIGVRPGASSGAFTTLSPLQPLNSTPYTIRSLNAMTADGLSVACINCVTSGQINTVQGAQVTGNIAGGQITGAIPVASVPAGSGNYVQNTTTQQAAANFNISGSGTAGGTLSGNIVNATTQFNLNASRVLSVGGTNNLFAGLSAGGANTTGSGNAFIGQNAGAANTTASSNSFFGYNAGAANTVGTDNSFFGWSAGANNTNGNNSFFGSLAGLANTTGNSNAFFGLGAGRSNVEGYDNSFFGAYAGWASTAICCNSFFGSRAGYATTTGSGNSMFGWHSGDATTTGNWNAFFGYQAGDANTTGSNNTIVGTFADVGANNLTYATALGSGAVVSANNTIVLGRAADTVQVPGNLAVSGTFTGNLPAGSGNYIQNTTTQQASANFNIAGSGTAGGTLAANIISAAAQFNLGGSRILSRPGTSNLFVGLLAGLHNVTGQKNSFFGESAGEVNETGSYNAFFGASTGGFNTTGNYNSFFGFAAGGENNLGSRNSFFGASAGLRNAANSDNSFFGHRAGEYNTADGNSFFGADSGGANTTGNNNAFFGFEAGTANTTANYNAFFGSLAGTANTTGDENAFFGRRAGELNTTGVDNTFLGWGAGNTNTTGSQNTILGHGADVVSNNLTYATAVGAGATVSTSSTIALGRSAGSDTVRIPGKLVVGTLSAATATHLCINGSDELAACSSSLRYKQNIAPLTAGMNLIQRLRPVTFDWKESNVADLGLIAEEVAAVEPLLVTRNHAGEIQGVKYDQLTVVLINALKQQQAEIKQLKEIVCAMQPQAAVCQAKTPPR